MCILFVFKVHALYYHIGGRVALVAFMACQDLPLVSGSVEQGGYGQ